MTYPKIQKGHQETPILIKQVNRKSFCVDWPEYFHYLSSLSPNTFLDFYSKLTDIKETEKTSNKKRNKVGDMSLFNLRK